MTLKINCDSSTI